MDTPIPMMPSVISFPTVSVPIPWTYTYNADGDAIPSTLSKFNDNLLKMENVNGKYYGYDSRGPVRVRVEMHEKKLDFNGTLNPYHEMPHFHIYRRSKGSSGSWIEKFTDF